MNSSKKRVCILYRTNSILPTDEPEMNRQRTVCLSFVKQKGWLPIREFWEKVDDETGPAKNDDALVELRAGAEQGRFDILLVSEFARIGRVPLECSFAAAFFERSGVEVWDTVTGHIGLCVLH